MNCELLDPQLFNVYRKDRCPKNSGLSRGGGVLIATRSHFNVKTLKLHYELHNIDIDQLILLITFSNSFELIVIVSYIPPNSSLEIYECHFNNCNHYLDNLRDHQHVMYVGDFNLGHLSWQFQNAVMPSEVSSSIDFSLLEFVSLNTLTQINNIPNESNRILDLILVSTDYLTKLFPPDCPLFDKTFHHSPVVVELSIIRYQSLTTDSKFVYNFKKADFHGLNSYLSLIDWETCLKPLDLKSMYSTFLNTFLNAINNFVPKKPVLSSRKPPWYNKRLSNLKNKKSKSYKRYRSDPDDIVLKQTYIKLQKEFDTLNAFLYKTYIISTEDSVKKNSKMFWQFINSKRKSNGLPSYMFYLDNDSSDTSVICNLFADYFKSVYSNSDSSPLLSDLFSSNPVFNISTLNLSLLDVESALLAIDDNTSLDLHGIANFFLKNCAINISLPLLLIFNKSLSSGSFLDDWKLSQIVPIHKSGCKEDIRNYRPISKLPCIPKLFESIITNKISPHINKWLSECQHGFRAGRSTVTNLALFCNHVFNNFEHRLQTDVIYTDFAKAFDKVNHSILIQKLNSLGFKSQILSWLSSYLINRFQIVKIGASFSNKFKVTSGVPQGSHLGPVLFLLFINDLPGVVKHSVCLLFADDLKIFRSISSKNDCQLLQSDLNAVSIWCKNNHLTLNIKKCQCMTFCRSSVKFSFQYNIDLVELIKIDSVKDLGVLFDSKLTFCQHIDYIISKSLAMLGFVQRNSAEFNDPSTILCLYNSLVRPHLEYCSVIWNPILISHCLRIEKVQKKFTRIAFYKLGWQMERPSYLTRCALFGMSSLENRRKMFSIIFIRDLIHNNIQCPELLDKLCFYSPQRPLREKFHFVLKLCRSKFTQSETMHNCCKITNDFVDKIDIFETRERHIFKLSIVMILNQK